MDLKEYKKTLDNLPEATIAKYFNNDNSKYIQAKSQMMEIIKKTDENIPLSNQPFFTSYLIRNLLFLCKNRPDFVGSVLYANVNKKISGIAGLTGAACITTSFLPTSKETISTAENLYQEARKKLYKIQDSSKILKKEINDVLKLIEPISIAKNYKNVLQTYYVLYSELRFSLQLLYHIEDIDKTFDFNMSLEENNTPLLDVLGHTDLNLEKYSKNTFITGVNNDLKKLYSKIEQSHQGSKTQDRVSDSGSVTAKPTNVDKTCGLLGHIEGLIWDEITITLISFESIRITTRDFKQTYHFSELDMKDKRSSEKSDGNWKLLSLFAVKNGTVTFKEIDDTRNYSSPKKAISTLQNKLKQVIGLQNNPIEKYKRRVGYVARFYIKNEIPTQFHGSDQQIEKIYELKVE